MDAGWIRHEVCEILSIHAAAFGQQTPSAKEPHYKERGVKVLKKETEGPNAQNSYTEAGRDWTVVIMIAANKCDFRSMSTAGRTTGRAHSYTLSVAWPE